MTGVATLYKSKEEACFFFPFLSFLLYSFLFFLCFFVSFVSFVLLKSKRVSEKNG